jgi:hypothetical protein
LAKIEHFTAPQLLSEYDSESCISPLSLDRSGAENDKHSLRKVNPIVLTAFTDASFAVALKLRHLGTSMPSRDVHPVVPLKPGPAQAQGVGDD